MEKNGFQNGLKCFLRDIDLEKIRGRSPSRRSVQTNRRGSPPPTRGFSPAKVLIFVSLFTLTGVGNESQIAVVV